jgi:hypothetical protein
VAALCYGVADCIFNTQVLSRCAAFSPAIRCARAAPQVYSVLGERYPEGELVNVFTVYQASAPSRPRGHVLGSAPPLTMAGTARVQLLQSVGSAVGFFYSPLLPLHGDDGTLFQIWANLALVVVATGTFWAAAGCGRPKHHTQHTALAPQSPLP